MSDAKQENWAIPEGVGLRTELGLRGLSIAAKHRFLHERTDGSVPGIIFGRGEDGRHGNFHPLSYRQILHTPQWARRLEKVHTGWRRVRHRSDWEWKELDCANSSDALLMNIFCYPGVMAGEEVRAMLGTGPGAVPEFGFRPRVPLSGGRRDTTEIDMVLGDLLIEAKLTESNFQTATEELLLRYRDMEAAFDVRQLPRRRESFSGYQLIRGTLAAYASGHSFCVCCDARRPDLIEEWYGVLCAVRSPELRCRLQLLTWQELAGALPYQLRLPRCQVRHCGAVRLVSTSRPGVLPLRLLKASMTLLTKDSDQSSLQRGTKESLTPGPTEELGRRSGSLWGSVRWAAMMQWAALGSRRRNRN